MHRTVALRFCMGKRQGAPVHAWPSVVLAWLPVGRVRRAMFARGGLRGLRYPGRFLLACGSSWYLNRCGDGIVGLLPPHVVRLRRRRRG